MNLTLTAKIPFFWPIIGVFAGGWAVDMCGGYRGAKQRVVALKVCAVFGTTADTTTFDPVSPSLSLSLSPTA